MIKLSYQIERFSPNQIIVHFIIGISIMMLYLTGIPHLYPEHLGWILKLMGLSNALFIHRLAAIGLLSSAIYYLIYSVLYWKFIDRTYFNKIVYPTSKDIVDFMNDNLTILGMRQQRTDYDKYSWLQKGLIWSVIIIDCLILGMSGIVLWAPWLFAPFLPISYLLTIKLIHGSLAIVSLCVILPHFYIVHLTAFRFPLDNTMVTGTISKEESMQEHPYWYRELSGEKYD